MSPEQEKQQLNILRDTLCQLHVADTKQTAALNQILTHLNRINSTLSAIDRNLTLLEMKK